MITTNNELLQLLDRLYREDAAENITLQNCAPGEYLCEQGRNVRNVVVIRRGIAKSFHIEENTKKYILFYAKNMHMHYWKPWIHSQIELMKISYKS